MKTNESPTASKSKRARYLQPNDPKILGMLLRDTLRNYTGHVDDRFVGYLLREHTVWLPRIPQASAYIQKWALTDNSMLLFTDIEWKFDLEADFPGVTAWIQDCRLQALAYQQSTPQLSRDGTPLTWCSRKEHLNDDSWLEWRMIYDLASPFHAHRVTVERREALRVMDWPSAKELIQFMLNEGTHEIQEIKLGEFDFTAG